MKYAMGRQPIGRLPDLYKKFLKLREIQKIVLTKSDKKCIILL